MLDGFNGPCEIASMRALALALILPFTACEAAPPPAPTAQTTPQTTPPAAPAPPATAGDGKQPDPRLARATAAGGALQGQLKEALTAALARGGPVAAIDVCATTAPAIAKALSVDGLTVGRTSTKLRNAANVTPTWVAPHLERWAKLPAAERGPHQQHLDDGRFAWAAPITAQPLCLTCHGTAVADDVKAAIAARYPQDTATGYAEGDLRGAVWVEVR